MSAFVLAAKDAGHFSDVLAAASNNANTNVGLLGESFKYIATSAGTYKLSAEDTAVALGLMANMGIKGTQSGTELKNAMVKPTDQQTEAMQKLDWMTTEYVHSVDSDKVTKAQRGVEKATLDVQTAQARYNKILSELGENSSQAVSANERVQKAQDKVNTATKNVTEAQKKYDQTVKDYGKESPKAQKAYQQLQLAQEKLATATKDLHNAQEKYGKAVANNTADSPKAVAARNALEKAQLNLKDA